jgi:Cof subfamily protein (haloacid dehalogenase superfamily)
MLVDNKDNVSRVIRDINPKYKEEFSMVRSSDIFLEFLNKNTNKGMALEALAKHLNVKRDEVMAIGDQDNDKSMILYAGIGVAMENAYPEVKKCANFITLDNESSGVAYAINKFVLEGKD